MTKRSKRTTEQRKARANALRGATLAALLTGSLLGAQPTSAETTGLTSLSTREALTSFESSLRLLTDLEAPVPVDYFQGQDRVTGTVAPDVKKVRLYKGDTYVRTGAIQDGRFAIYTRDVHPRAGEDWKIIPVGEDGRPGQIATLDAALSMSAVTTVDAYVEGDTYLTGKTTSADAIRLYVDGKEKRAVKVAADGTFKLYVLDFGLKAGTDLEVVALDADRREGAPTTAASETFAPSVKVTDSSDRMDFGSILAAYGSPYSRVAGARLYINGVFYNTVGLNGDSYDDGYNIHFYLPDASYGKSDTNVYEIVTLDARGREGGRVTLTPNIRVNGGYNSGYDEFRAYVGRGTHRVVIKDAAGQVLDAADHEDGQLIKIPMDRDKYTHNETYYLYPYDSKGNEGPVGSFVFKWTNASYETYTPPAEKGWPVGGNAR